MHPWFRVFLRINIVSIGYFQSVERAKYATFITLLRGFILLTLCFYGLPLLLGKPGIWLAHPAGGTVDRSFHTHYLYRQEKKWQGKINIFAAWKSC